MEISDFYNFDSKLRFAEELQKRGAAAFGPLQFETDPEMINLSLLASAPIIDPEVLRADGTRIHIENVPLADIHINTTFDVERELTRYLALYDLIVSGSKIYPATVVRGYDVVNGEAREPVLSQPIHVCDGAHRLAICRCLSFETVPILFIDVVQHISYSRELFAAEPAEPGGRPLINFVHKETGKVYSLDVSRVYPIVDSGLNWKFGIL